MDKVLIEVGDVHLNSAVINYSLKLGNIVTLNFDAFIKIKGRGSVPISLKVPVSGDVYNSEGYNVVGRTYKIVLSQEE